MQYEEKSERLEEVMAELEQPEVWANQEKATGRSQHQNKDTAMKQLKAKLYELEMQKRNAESRVLEDSKSDVSWGTQIRSYVLDSGRIKDLRTGYESTNTQAVLDGDLENFIKASLKQGV